MNIKKIQSFVMKELKQESWFGSFLRSKPDRYIWEKMRYLYWKNLLGHMGSNVKIHTGVMFTNPQNIDVGNDFSFFQYSTVNCGIDGEIRIKGNGHLGTGARIESMGSVIMGEGIEIGPNSVIFSHTADTTHGHKGAVPDAPRKKMTTIIEDNCQIGSGSIVLAGSHIHQGAVIGAGSVVKGEISKYSVVAGVPAKFIKKR